MAGQRDLEIAGERGVLKIEVRLAHALQKVPVTSRQRDPVGLPEANVVDRGAEPSALCDGDVLAYRAVAVRSRHIPAAVEFERTKKATRLCHAVVVTHMWQIDRVKHGERTGAQ